jgi:dolichol-phosphate mannosyltransferase
MITAPLELAVVVPTFNERSNVDFLLEALSRSLEGIEYEVIFVDDDSTDGTAEAIQAIGLRNPRVRVLRRIGRRGLSSASLEGMLATAAPYIALIDADLQHDERILPTMLAKLKTENLDLVVATRNAEKGGMGDFSPRRVRLSQLGRRLSRLITKTHLSDPMSGFFVLNRMFLERTVRSASGLGFKILVDLVSSAPQPVRLAEVPYTFRKRLHGSSKLDILVTVEYLQLILDKTVGDLIPPRFLTFSMVGVAGFLMFEGLQYLLLSVFALRFLTAQTIATSIVMTANFFLNNSLTYRDRRLSGSRLALGLLTFYAACSVGVLVNVRLALFAKDAGLPWYVAGPAGLAVGAIWNYCVTSITTWRQVRQRGTRVRETQDSKIYENQGIGANER